MSSMRRQVKSLIYKLPFFKEYLIFNLLLTIAEVKVRSENGPPNSHVGGTDTLRHLMASLMADNPKISTKTIQKILGYSESKTTEIYLHELDGSIENAMDSISGKFTQKNEKPQPKAATKK